MKKTFIFLLTNVGLTLLFCVPSIVSNPEFLTSELVDLLIFVCGFSLVIFCILSATNFFERASRILK